MERKKVKMQVVFPLRYAIKPDTGEAVDGMLDISVDFTLHKYLGPEYLAIDFGTSAVAVAFEGDPINLGLRDAKGSPCLLDLNNFLRTPLSMNPQAGTRLMPSICCLHPMQEENLKLNRLGDAGFIHLPMHWGAVGEDWDLAIPYLKMLMGAGLTEVPLPDRIEYLDWEGEKTHGNPSLQGVVLSAYKALREQYIETYLRDSKRLEVWDKLIVTYPNTFTFTQVKFLRRVLRQAFPDKDPLVLISESDAVANYYLSIEPNLRSGKDQIRQKEYILIYDIGAGTLDLTYLCVEREERSKTPQRISYKAKMGVPIAGNHLDIRLAYLLDRRLRAIEEDAMRREISFRYESKIVGVGQHWKPRDMFNLWLSILQFKASYAKDPEATTISLNLGPINIKAGSPIIKIEDFLKDSDFYGEHGLFSRKDEQLGDCYFIDIPTRELKEDTGIERWVHFLTEEVILEFSKNSS